MACCDPALAERSHHPAPRRASGRGQPPGAAGEMNEGPPIRSPVQPLMRPQRNDGGLGGRNLVLTTARHSWRRPYLGICSDAVHSVLLSPGLASGLFLRLATENPGFQSRESNRPRSPLESELKG